MFLDKKTRVQADLLCTNGVLYQGIVAQHFIRSGSLTGIFLSEPKRFDRDRYQKAKDGQQNNGGQKPETKDYWVKIPSESLYFFGDKIFNMNLTYIPAEGKVAEIGAVKKLIIEVLGGKFGSMNITVTEEPDSESSDDSDS